MLPSEFHAEGMGSISEQFTLPVTERIQLVSACAAQSAWGACSLQPRARRGWGHLVLLVLLTKA